MTQFGTIASTLVSVILPVFGLILLGRLLVRFRVIDPSGTKGLTGVIFWILLPALLFVSILDSRSQLGLETLAVYFGVAIPVFGAAILCGTALFNMTVAQAAVFGLNAAYGNLVLLGIPMVSAIWGPQGLSVLLAIIAAHSLVFLPVATVLVEIGSKLRGRRPTLVVRDAVLGSFKNPIVSSIIAATCWRWTGLPTPDAFRRAVELLAQSAPALSLLSLGASLPTLRSANVGPAVLLSVATKLVVLPLCMAFAVRLAAIPAPASAVMIVTAAMPTGANAFLLAHRSGSMMEASAATVVIATVLAVVTLSLTLAVLR